MKKNKCSLSAIVRAVREGNLPLTPKHQPIKVDDPLIFQNFRK